MGWRSALVRLLCLALMVSAALWPLNGRAKASDGEPDAVHVQKSGCCKGEASHRPTPADPDDDCCKSCAFGACCLRLMVVERGIVWVVGGDVVEVPGVVGPVVLAGLVQLEDIFHPPRA